MDLAPGIISGLHFFVTFNIAGAEFRLNIGSCWKTNCFWISSYGCAFFSSDRLLIFTCRHKCIPFSRTLLAWKQFRKHSQVALHIACILLAVIMRLKISPPIGHWSSRKMLRMDTKRKIWPAVPVLMSARRVGAEPAVGTRAPLRGVLHLSSAEVWWAFFPCLSPFPHIRNLLMFVIDCIARMLKY